VPKYDVTKLNVAIDRPFVTERRRPSFLLQAYYSHGFLEIAGLECQA
jgi:hypothetical protein